MISLLVLQDSHHYVFSLVSLCILILLLTSKSIVIMRVCSVYYTAFPVEPNYGIQYNLIMIQKLNDILAIVTVNFDNILKIYYLLILYFNKEYTGSKGSLYMLISFGYQRKF